MIKEVTYTEARLISTAQYENMRIEIAATVSVDPLRGTTEDAVVSLSEAEKFVRDALTERIVTMEEAKKGAARALTVDGVRKKYGL
jgi:hypothetical protein